MQGQRFLVSIHVGASRARLRHPAAIVSLTRSPWTRTAWPVGPSIRWRGSLPRWIFLFLPDSCSSVGLGNWRRRQEEDGQVLSVW